MKHLISTSMVLILVVILAIDLCMDFGLKPLFALVITFLAGMGFYSNIKD